MSDKRMDALGSESSEGLGAIADQIQHWLDYNEGGFLGCDPPMGDDTHVIPPVWPTRGMLKNWVKVLRA